MRREKAIAKKECTLKEESTIKIMRPMMASSKKMKEVLPLDNSSLVRKLKKTPKKRLDALMVPMRK